jgi:hypothetical protein
VALQAGIICRVPVDVNRFRAAGVGGNPRSGSELPPIIPQRQCIGDFGESGGRRPTREGGLPCRRLRTDVGQLKQPANTKLLVLAMQHHNDRRNVRT